MVEYTFRSRFGHRQWRLDDAGIHEFHQGQPYASVAWDSVESFNGFRLRTIDGASSTILLPKDQGAMFRLMLFAEWQHRFPERFHANQARQWRQATWIALLGMPLLYVLTDGLLLVLMVTTRHGMSTAQAYTGIARLTWAWGLLLGATWIGFGYGYWKFQHASRTRSLELPPTIH